MDITKTDIVLISGMALAIFGISFTFPALGMTGDSHEVNETEVPEFNLTEGEFDFADDLPEFPLRPDRGYLNNSSTVLDDFRGQAQDELGQNDVGNRTIIVALNSTHVRMTDLGVISGTGEIDIVEFTSAGEVKTLSGDGFKVDVHSEKVGGSSGEFEWQIEQRPGDSTILGSLFNTADKVANVLGFIFVSIVVVSQMIVEGALNIGNALINIGTFVIDFLHFMLSTYRVVLDAAPANWAKVFILTPMVILFAEFMKLSIITVNTLKPT